MQKSDLSITVFEELTLFLSFCEFFADPFLKEGCFIVWVSTPKSTIWKLYTDMAEIDGFVTEKV